MRHKEITFYGIIGKRNNVIIPNAKNFLKEQGSTTLLLEIKNTKFYSNVSYQNFSHSLYLPQSITESLNLNSRDKVEIKIIGILKKKLGRTDISKLSFLLNKQLRHEKLDYKKEIVDMKEILSDKIRVLNNAVSFVIKDAPHQKLLVSYRYSDVKRKNKSVIIKRYIPLYPFAQFLGFYIGDGTTSQSTGSVSFINIAKDVVEWSMNFIRTYFESKLKYRLVYGPTRPNEKNSGKLIKYWSEIGISFMWSINKGYKNPSKFGAMRVDTINMALKLIILKSLEEISKMATKDSTIAKFFLKGLAMSDMYPSINNGVLGSVSVAFKEGDKNSIGLYRRIFNAYGMKVKTNSRQIKNTTALSTYRMEDFIKMLIDGIFEFHKTREGKLIKGLLNMDLFSRYFKRLKFFLEGPLTAYELTKKSELSDIPYEQLERLINFGLINKTATYPRLYFITNRGKELLNVLSI